MKEDGERVSAAMERPLIEEMTPEDVRGLAFDDNARVQAEFLSRWQHKIETACTAISGVHIALNAYRRSVETSPRSAAVEAFLHSGLYSLIAALHHLVSGYPIAAGHMLRHFIESVAMALLCADDKSNDLASWRANMSDYPVQKAPGKLLRKRVQSRLKALLGFEGQAWRQLLETTKTFDARSHATGLTIAHQNLFDEEERCVVGGEFDTDKVVAYEQDLDRITGAAGLLEQLAHALADALPASRRAP